VGTTVTESRNWNPDCPDHGVESEWYQSDEQSLRRAEQNRNLRALQIQARAARLIAPCTCSHDGASGCAVHPFPQEIQE
jgi:hypothetical protein